MHSASTASRQPCRTWVAEAPFSTAWEHSDMQVRAAADLAFIRYRARLSFPSGKVVDCWHMDVYERRATGWLAVWSKATAVRSPSA